MGAECIIGREHHQDGGIHLHVFVDFGRKYRSRRADTFDVGGFHPNISQSYGTPEKGYDYACKDGDVVAGGLDRPVPTEGRGGDSKTHSIWSQITSATTRESFWDLVHDLDPKSAVTCFTQLQKYCDWKYRYCPPPTNHQQELDLEMILVMEEAIGCYSLELAARELEESNH